MNTIEEMIKDLYQEQEEKQDPKNVNRLTEEERQEIQYARDQIYRELEEQRERDLQLQRDWFAENTPHTGEITNEDYELPLSTSKEVLKDPNINYLLYGGATLISNFGGKANNYNQRFLYKNKINKLSEVMKLNESRVPKTPRKIDLALKKVLKSESNLYTVENTSNGLVYKLNYAPDGNKYVTINHKQLRQLVIGTNEGVLKTYVLMKYLLTDYDPSTKTHTFKTKKITNDYICREIGLSDQSKNNLQKISTITNMLETLGYIKKEKIVETYWSEEDQAEKVKQFNQYTLCTYEEWAEKNPKEAKKRN